MLPASEPSRAARSGGPGGDVGAVVVVGASAGGVQALRHLVGGFTAELPAAVLVVLHIPPHAPSALAAILDRAGPLPADTAAHGKPLRTATIVVAPADRHLVIADGHVRLSGDPAESGHRPALDPLFRSAAEEFGAHAVGVVLSGNQDDGTAGLAAVVARGGAAFVQLPDEAWYSGMPRSALARVPDARALPVAEIGRAIGELLTGTAAPDEPAGPRMSGRPGTGPDRARRGRPGDRA